MTVAKWNERLHPRDVRGRFRGRGGGPAARAERREGNRVAPGQRGRRARGYAGVGARATGGVVSGVLSVEVGRRQGSRPLVAGGLVRVGTSLAEARASGRDVRSRTSRRFAGLDVERQQDERAAGRRRVARYRLGNTALDVGLSRGVSNALERTVRGEPTPGDRRAARRAPRRAARNAAPRRANRRGIYDVTSSPVRKPRTKGGRRAAGWYGRPRRSASRSGRGAALRRGGGSRRALTSGR